jgi:hypothetical protein
MDFFDILWNVRQDREIGGIRQQVEKLDRNLVTQDLPNTKELAEENRELKLRLAILVRLMIAKGVITAREYASLLTEARPSPRD